MEYLKIDRLPEIEPNPPKNPPMIKIRGLLHRDRQGLIVWRFYCIFDWIFEKKFNPDNRGQDKTEPCEKKKEKLAEKERKRERKRKATEEFIRSKREK